MMFLVNLSIMKLKFRHKHFRLSLGFTLLELLVVISIIGILLAVGATAFSTAQKKARDSRRRSDMKALQNAFEQYYATNGTYSDCTTMGNSNLSGGYTSVVDPKNSGDYTYQCTGNATTNTYCACAKLETQTGNSSANDCNHYSHNATNDYFCVSNLQ